MALTKQTIRIAFKNCRITCFVLLWALCLFAIPAQPALANADPLAGASFYIDPATNDAADQAAKWRSSRPADAALMDLIALRPRAFWMGDWTPNSQQTASDYTSRASAAGKTGVIVAYDIPDRDCGSYSAGGASSPANYQSWIDGLAAGIGVHRTVVILEPDALAQLDCLDNAGKQARINSLTYAVGKLKSASKAVVYLDVGNSGWLSSATAASRLQQADVSAADGFSLNVSNFYTTSDSISYGTDISKRIGSKHFIIDTSRNGRGSNGEWCNPAGRALGAVPTTATQSALADAYLWIKAPGESDGTCNGGPAAGAWWPDYALGLAQRSQSPASSTTAASSHIAAASSAGKFSQPATKPPVSKPPTGSAAGVMEGASIILPEKTLPEQPLIVAGVFTIPGISQDAEQTVMSLDGRSLRGATINTRYLTNGLHVLIIRTTESGDGTSVQYIRMIVQNRLSFWETGRNKLVSLVGVNGYMMGQTIVANLVVPLALIFTFARRRLLLLFNVFISK